MKKVGITDYEAFARAVLEVVTDKPISFEVFSDDFPDMRRQALKIRDWQENVYVKIPVTNTRRESALPLIKRTRRGGGQTQRHRPAHPRAGPGRGRRARPGGGQSVVSVFAGRIADTGVDPFPIMLDMRLRSCSAPTPQAELLWASVREVLNIFQAADSGCHIVTVTHDILAKASKTRRHGSR